MGIALTTIGVKLGFAVETEKGVRPTTGYKRVYGWTETASMDAAPEALETTTMDNEKYKTYTQGLIDLGGALDYTARFTQEFYDDWAKLYKNSEEARAKGLATWMVEDIPSFDKSIFVPVELNPIGIPSLSTNSVIDVTVHLTQSGEIVFAEDLSDDAWVA
jgi:hypothetical protein